MFRRFWHVPVAIILLLSLFIAYKITTSSDSLLESTKEKSIAVRSAPQLRPDVLELLSSPPKRTKSSQRTVNEEKLNEVDDIEIATSLKRREARRLRTIKILEDAESFKIHAVFDMPSPDEKIEIVELLQKLPSGSIDHAFSAKSKDQIVDELAVGSAPAGSKHYIIELHIKKSEPEIGRYKINFIREGNLSYDPNEIPSGKIEDYLNWKSHSSISSMSDNGRFSEIIQY